MSKELPLWVWDMIIGLLEQEDIHPKLYMQKPAGKAMGYDYEPANWCAGVPLNQVPVEIRGQAQAIREYKRMAALDNQEGNGADEAFTE